MASICPNCGQDHETTGGVLPCPHEFQPRVFTITPIPSYCMAIENARMALVRSVGCAMGSKDVRAVIASLRRDGWTITPPWSEQDGGA